MLNVLLNISNIIIPALLFYVIGYGIVQKRNVYEDFLEGAGEGLKMIIKLVPTFIGLMTAVGVLRASGVLEGLGLILYKPLAAIGIPGEIFPLLIIKMVSSSASTGLVLDLFKTYGPDSTIGMTVSILMSCTETIFYTMSVYFLAAKVSKSRWTLPGALFSTAVGTLLSILLAKL